MNFEKAIENLKSIKLSGGIFGKTNLLLLVLTVCVSSVAWKIGSWWFALIVLLILMGLIFYAIKRCFDFAMHNPQAAIMDGSEFLVHERIVHGIKNQGSFLPKDFDIAHPSPEISEAEISAADALPISESEQNTTPIPGEKE